MLIIKLKNTFLFLKKSFFFFFTSFSMAAFNPDGCSIIELKELFCDEWVAFQFALDADLLADNTYCQYCNEGIYMLIKDNGQKFGCRVKCNKCGMKKSILDGTIFTRSHITLNKALYIIYCWSQKFSIDQTCFETKVSKSTVISFYESLRDAAYEWSEDHQMPMGGEGKHVEIDETQFSKRKNHQGRMMPGSDIWVFGGICREDKKAFAMVVPDRSATTLIPIITTYIQNNTTIYSDCWGSYNSISNLPHNYDHQQVNHSQNFVDPITNAHTQTIERMWRDLKDAKKRYNGVKRDEIETHIGEFLWRKNECVKKHNAFRKTLELLIESHFE